jgi:hypothetical protein
MRAGMLRIVNQRKSRVMNLSILKYAVIPTPMYSMSLLRHDLQAQCHPKFDFQHECFSSLPFTSWRGCRASTVLAIKV